MGPSLSCMPVPPAPPVCRITMAPRPAIWLGANGPLLSPFLSVFNTKSSRLMATSLPKRGATSTATTIQCPPRSEPSNSFTASGFVYAVAVITTDSFSPRASGGLLLSLLRAAPRDTTQTSTSAIPATRATIIRASASIIPGSLILHHSCGADLQVCPTRVMEYKRTGYNACGGSYDGGPSRRNRAGAGLGSVTGGGPQQRKQQAAGSPRRERIGGNHRNGVYEARSGEGIARFGPGRALYRGRGGSGAAFWQGGRHQPRRFRVEDRQKWREKRAVRAQPDRGARRHGDPADRRCGRHRHAR